MAGGCWLVCPGCVCGCTLASDRDRRAVGIRWYRTSISETREVAGQDLPEFRGTTTINADLYELAAILDDLGKFCDWNKRCIVTKRTDPRR